MVKNLPTDAASVGVHVIREPSKKSASRLKVAFGDHAGLRDPLHQRLRQSILVVLADGYWAPGDKLPAFMESEAQKFKRIVDTAKIEVN